MGISSLGLLRPLGKAGAYGTYGYASGTGAAVVAVPAGAYLSSVAAFATAAGATVQIGAGNLIPVPNPGSVAADVENGLQGPLNITFVGTSGYLVDWMIP